MTRYCIWKSLFLLVFLLLAESLIRAEGNTSHRTGVANVKPVIGDDDVMIVYTVTDSVLEIHTSTRQDEWYTQQSLDPVFWSTLGIFRRKLKCADFAGLTIPAEILYLYLVSPIQSFISGKKRMILEPGKHFGGLPFEALIRKDVDSGSSLPAAPRYLVCDFEIVYLGVGQGDNLSESRLRDGCRDDCQSPDGIFSGFSTGGDSDHFLPDLPFARAELAGIAELWHQRGGVSIIDTTTGRGLFQAFAQMIPRKVIHFAAHYNPGIGERAPGETADLVVLNGCATGVAQENGANSLPKLLHAAGVQNVLSTLWNVTDHVACSFMIDFYRTWLSGKSCGEALREVKIKWISHAETSLPALWAAYVLTGQ